MKWTESSLDPFIIFWALLPLPTSSPKVVPLWEFVNWQSQILQLVFLGRLLNMFTGLESKSKFLMIFLSLLLLLGMSSHVVMDIVDWVVWDATRAY